MKKLFERWRRYSGSLLIESRVSDMKEKYPDHKHVVDFFDQKDPSRKNNNKYLEWMMKQRIEKDMPSGYILKAVGKFVKNKQRLEKKDLYQYDNPKEIIKAVNKLGKSNSKIRDELQSEVIKQYEDDEWLILLPKTERASCYYGSGTKWCISGQENNQFESYREKGMIFVFVVDKSKSPQHHYSKWALVYPDDYHGEPSETPGEVYDANDDLYSPDKIREVYGEETQKNIFKIASIAVDKLYEKRREEKIKKDLKKIEGPVGEEEDKDLFRTRLKMMHYTTSHKVLERLFNLKVIKEPNELQNVIFLGGILANANRHVWNDDFAKRVFKALMRVQHYEKANNDFLWNEFQENPNIPDELKEKIPEEYKI